MTPASVGVFMHLPTEELQAWKPVSTKTRWRAQGARSFENQDFALKRMANLMKSSLVFRSNVWWEFFTVSAFCWDNELAKTRRSAYQAGWISVSPPVKINRQTSWCWRQESRCLPSCCSRYFLVKKDYSIVILVNVTPKDNEGQYGPEKVGEILPVSVNKLDGMERIVAQSLKTLMSASDSST